MSSNRQSSNKKGYHYSALYLSLTGISVGVAIFLNLPWEYPFGAVMVISYLALAIVSSNGPETH